MFALALFLMIQVNNPYTSREDQGLTTKVVLHNGLTVIVRENPAVPLTSITTMVKAGYFDEEDRISGISHVVEHMFFKGTATRAVGEIARETKALGGYLNAYTDYDRTCYYTVVPSENGVQALAIQADALWNSAFDAGELKREIEVVLQENNRKLDNPSAVASEKLYEVAFQQHRMGRWRIGTPAGLRALTRDDLVAYFQRYYRPSNIILTVVGPFDRDQMLADVARLYGDVPETPAVMRDVSPAEPVQTGIRLGSRKGSIQQARVAIGYHTPGALAPEAPAFAVLAAILSQGRASRLNQYLRDAKGSITSASASTNVFEGMGFFEIDVEAANVADAQIGVLAELESIKQFGVTNEAVARAKAQIAQNYLAQLETVDGIGEDLALNEALGDWKRSLRWLPDIDKVTGGQVVDVVRKYLTSSNLSVFEYLPESSVGNSATIEDYRGNILTKVSAAIPEHKEAELAVSARMPELTDSIAVAGVKPIVRRSIMRGPDVYIIEDRRLPVVSFGIFFPGGRLLESAENSGITELMLRTALRGAARLDSADIARRLENAGAHIEVVNDPDFFGYIVEGLSGRMAQALEVLMSVLQQPSFDPQEVERQKALQLASLQNLRDDNYAYPVRLFMQSLFGSHSYARPGIGTAESVAKLTADDLRKWFQTNERKILPLIVIAGDSNGTSLVAPLTDRLTNEDLTDRPVSKQPMAGMTLISPNSPSVISTGRQQTAMVYGFPGATLSAADQYPLVVLRNIVSGQGGRYFDTIREKQGLAYTVNTTNAFLARGGAVYTYAAFSPENEAAVRASLEAEIERIREDGVRAEEVSKAIAYSVGDHERGMQTHNGMVLEHARAIYSGTGIQSVGMYSDQIRRVTPQQIREVAIRVFDPALRRVVIARGKPKD